MRYIYREKRRMEKKRLDPHHKTGAQVSGEIAAVSKHDKWRLEAARRTEVTLTHLLAFVSSFFPPSTCATQYFIESFKV